MKRGDLVVFWRDVVLWGQLTVVEPLRSGWVMCAPQDGPRERFHPHELMALKAWQAQENDERDKVPA